MSKLNTLRASVIQACTVGYDLEATLNKMESFVDQAKAESDTQLAVFPEAFIGGYPKGSTFGCVIGERQDSGRDEYLAYYNSAITIPGLAIERIESISRKTGVFIVSGVIEKDGGSLYCTAIWVHPVDGLIGKRRKLMPTASERLVWAQGGPEDVKLMTTSLPFLPTTSLKISATICWENYMPLLRQRLYDLGTQIYCAPTVDGREVWLSSMVHIALEGRCFVLSACQMSHSAHTGFQLFPNCVFTFLVFWFIYFSKQKDHVTDGSKETKEGSGSDGEEIKIAGGSVIIDPMGKILAGPLRGKEGILTAELDLDTIIRGKFDLDVSGHYARKDIFRLDVQK